MLRPVCSFHQVRSLIPHPGTLGASLYDPLYAPLYDPLGAPKQICIPVSHQFPSHHGEMVQPYNQKRVSTTLKSSVAFHRCHKSLRIGRLGQSRFISLLLCCVVLSGGGVHPWCFSETVKTRPVKTRGDTRQ
eukprot:2615282-Pyramimonas_sp.AAC.1